MKRTSQIFDALYFAPIFLFFPISSYASMGPPEFMYVNALPLSELFLIIYYASYFFILYFGVLLCVACSRRMKQKPHRLLFKYSLLGFSVCLVLISWQFILPCEYTPIGCRVSTEIRAPQLPINLVN